MSIAIASSPLESTPASPAWLVRLGRSIWRAMAASGQARASRHLLDLAQQYEATQPGLAAELRVAALNFAQE